MLDVDQLQAIGARFMSLLRDVKHSGAVDKTQEGFLMAASRYSPGCSAAVSS